MQKAKASSNEDDPLGLNDEMAPPLLSLLPVGRQLKRLIRAGITFQRNGQRKTLSDAIFEATAGKFNEFAARDGAAFLVLTMLNESQVSFI